MCFELSDYLDIVPPKFLYHYTSVEGIEGIFQKNKLNLRFSTSKIVNDTTEGKVIVDILKNVALNLKKSGLIACEYYSAIVNHDYKFKQLFSTKEGYNFGVPKSTFIFCLCEDGDSLPMWNYYSKGDNYYGYNIKFNANVLKQCAELQCYDAIVRLSKVIYNNDEKIKILTNFILKYVGNNYEESIKIIECNLGMYQFLFKDKCFEYEKEWRLIVHTNTEEKRKHYQLDEFKNIFTLGSSIQETSCVSGITVGPLNNNKIVKLGLEKYLSDNNYFYLDTNISHSEIPIRNT